MTFEKFMKLYDNWNGKVKINDSNLNTVVLADTSRVMNAEISGLLEKIKDTKVTAFGFDEETATLLVRIKYNKRKANK